MQWKAFTESTCRLVWVPLLVVLLEAATEPSSDVSASRPCLTLAMMVNNLWAHGLSWRINRRVGDLKCTALGTMAHQFTFPAYLCLTLPHWPSNTTESYYIRLARTEFSNLIQVNFWPVHVIDITETEQTLLVTNLLCFTKANSDLALSREYK